MSTIPINKTSNSRMRLQAISLGEETVRALQALEKSGKSLMEGPLNTVLTTTYADVARVYDVAPEIRGYWLDPDAAETEIVARVASDTFRKIEFELKERNILDSWGVRDVIALIRCRYVTLRFDISPGEYRAQGYTIKGLSRAASMVPKGLDRKGAKNALRNALVEVGMEDQAKKIANKEHKALDSSLPAYERYTKKPLEYALLAVPKLGRVAAFLTEALADDPKAAKVFRKLAQDLVDIQERVEKMAAQAGMAPTLADEDE